MNKTQILIKVFLRVPLELYCYVGMLICNLLPRIDLVDRLRFLVLRVLGVKGHGRFTILSPIEIAPYCAHRRIRINGPSYINAGIRMAVPEGGSIIIEKNVMIGPRVQFECMNHRVSGNGGAKSHSGVIHVKEGAWIGAGSIILANSTIGERAIVAAGSVVRGDVDASTLVAGVPAIFKKNINI